MQTGVFKMENIEKIDEILSSDEFIKKYWKQTAVKKLKKYLRKKILM